MSQNSNSANASAGRPPARWNSRNVTAVLGPTNTGKTHMAIERMLGHESGLIGLPLRLLAREVFAKVAQRAGSEKVALITGEEKIIPPDPCYWVATVEAMPRETEVAFVAIDEVQLAADLERGHVFTDRMLNVRGSQETLLLGAATMRGIIGHLLPGVHIVTRPRMSVLSYAGQRKFTRLPERSAIVSFSADEVYATAELIRRQRGGAAVVLGALSPRTRNKQVEIYQSGDVDFLIATDAIGMGLNLDLDHVAFAANRKFDGFQFRDLNAAELGQIAGRAGRYQSDGTFGVTAQVDPFPDILVQALETHQFEPVRTLQWRSDQRDFSSVEALIASLDQPAQVKGLTRAQPAADQVALTALVKSDDVVDRLDGPAAIRTLWDVCRLPDYRKISPAQHAEIVQEIFMRIADNGAVPDDWIAAQIKHANRVDGDIDALSARIAQIRTWTFIANQPDWLSDPGLWRDETKKIEDALSDALHDRLTKRFIDRRTAVLMRRLKEKDMLEAEINAAGDVIVEGQHIGLLNGFRFTPDTKSVSSDADSKTVRATAQKALAKAISDRAGLIDRADDKEIVLSGDGFLRWNGAPVARLHADKEILKPDVIILADEHLSGPPRETVEQRLRGWVTRHLETVLKPLFDLQADDSLSGAARGIAYRLVEQLGILDRRDVLEEVRGLSQDERAGLRRNGVRFGAYHIYIPVLLKPGPSTLLARLKALKDGDIDRQGISDISAVSASGRTSTDVDAALGADIYLQFGFRIFGRRAVRIDILERLADLIRPALSWRPGSEEERPDGAVEDGRGFMTTAAMTSLLGASGDDMSTILRGLGYRLERKPAPETDKTVAATGVEGATAPEPADATSGTMAGNETVSEAATTDAGTDGSAAAVEVPEAEVQAGPEAADESVAEANGGKPEIAEAMPVEAESGQIASPEEQLDEPAMIEIWRPDYQGKKSRARGDRDGGAKRAPRGRDRSKKPQGQRGDNRKAGAGKKGRPGRRPPATDGKPPRRPSLDPDSPFAALAALKEEMSKPDSS